MAGLRCHLSLQRVVSKHHGHSSCLSVGDEACAQICAHGKFAECGGPALSLQIEGHGALEKQFALLCLCQHLLPGFLFTWRLWGLRDLRCIRAMLATPLPLFCILLCLLLILLSLALTLQVSPDFLFKRLLLCKGGTLMPI